MRWAGDTTYHTGHNQGTTPFGIRHRFFGGHRGCREIVEVAMKLRHLRPVTQPVRFDWLGDLYFFVKMSRFAMAVPCISLYFAMQVSQKRQILTYSDTSVIFCCSGRHDMS